MVFDFITIGKNAPRTDRHALGGMVTVDGSPAEKRIIVLLRRDFTVIATTFSNPTTGEWKVEGINEYEKRELIILALDSTGVYNAEVADYVTQVATA